MKIWAKIVNNRRMLRDITIEDHSDTSRTDKVLSALRTACAEFDLAVPMWLGVNIREFQATAKVRFSPDSFGEPVDFQYLELQVLEED